MKEQRHRFLCAVCALALVLTAVLAPAAWAAEGTQPEAEDSEKTTLTAEDASEMHEADAAVTALTDSDAYEQMTRDERLDAALRQLDDLAGQGLVEKDSIRVDEENGMVSYSYPCGVLGGILLIQPDELPETTVQPGQTGLDDTNGLTRINSSRALMPITADVRRAMERRTRDLKEQENALPDKVGTAAIYYAFDNTVNSTRFPYYAYMRGFWEGMGLRTAMNTRVTLSDLRRMNRYDLCILSAHGADYTYSYGTFRKYTRTEPIILLMEEATFYKDIIYSFDLLSHRAIKVNGRYAITADFFRNAYRSGQLSNTIIYSETCEFLGVSGGVDESMANALLEGGARAVLGYVNNVYTVYSRSMLWDTVNHLLLGQSVGDALTHAKDTYGENDIIWYTEQGGRRPHAVPAYLVLYGDADARLDVPDVQSEDSSADETSFGEVVQDILEQAA